MDHALVAETEHRSDGVQEHRMEIHLDHAVATGDPVFEHHSYGDHYDSEHVQGDDGITTRDQVARRHRQGDGRPPETRRHWPGIARLSATGAQGGGDQLGI